MFAHVYPLKRLPRRFTFFDYHIPVNLNAKVGDIVLVPLKGRNILGVIKEITKTTNVKKTLPIERIIHSEFLSGNDINRYERIASAIFQSPSTVLFSALPTFKERSGFAPLVNATSTLRIDRDTVTFLQNALSKKEEKSYLQLSQEGEYALASMLRKSSKDQILFLVPRERDADILSLSLNLGKQTAVLHGKISAPNRERIARAWQNGTIKTLVGTRQASLLPAKKLSVVHVLDCASEDYGHMDRNPRIDSRNASELLAIQHKAKLIYSGVSPRLSLLTSTKLHWQKNADIQLISLRAEEERTNHAFLSETLLKAISEALQGRKNVLLSFNRKGVAKQLQCKGCGHIPYCSICKSVPTVREHDLKCSVCHTEMWIPKVCPACKADKLSKKGLGNRELKQALKKLFPQATVGVIDKDTQEMTTNIQIVTEYFFKNVYRPFAKSTYGVVAEINVDLSLGGINFRSSEISAYKLQRLARFAKQQQAKCIVQTWIPDVTLPMNDIKAFLKREYELRERYKLPPVVPMATLTKKESDEIIHISLNTEQKICLKDEPDSCIIEIDTPTYDT